MRKPRGFVSRTRIRSPVPSARCADGERPRGLLGQELDMHVREMHLKWPDTLIHSPADADHARQKTHEENGT